MRCLILVIFLSLTGCEPASQAPASHPAPAKIEHTNEGDVSRIILTPEAEERLQISTTAVESRPFPRHRTLGGEVTIPDGSTIVVTAPLTGTLEVIDDQQLPVAGQKVKADQAVFDLRPFLSPDREVPTAAERVSMANAQASLLTAQITADGDVKQAGSQVEAAQIALDRSQQLFKDRVGSQRDVDDAQARFDLAQKTLEAAQTRKQQLEQLTLEVKTGDLVSVPIRSPQSGILRNVTASMGQTVNVGAALFEVVSLSKLWVRVAMYPGLEPEIAHDAPAIVEQLGTGNSGIEVHRVTAPPSGDPLAATIDVFYELSNDTGIFRPGERVEVSLPLIGEEESLIVPRAAILRDIHGVAWVYVNSADHEFRRHRVEVHFTTDKLTILSHGPPVGTEVVVDGAAELFGTEFGAGK